MYDRKLHKQGNRSSSSPDRVGCRPSDRDRIVAFLIPVISKQKAPDWSAVETNLSRTVNSILRSRDPRVLILIAHDEKPSGEYWQNNKVVSIALHPSTIRRGVRTKLDKSRKIKQAAHWIQKQGFKGVYIMLLDADDIINRRLTQHILSSDNMAAYNIVNGYEYDLANEHIRARLGNFHEVCGSCFIGYFRQDELPAGYDDTSSIFSQICDARHKDHASVSANLGKPADDVKFPAVAYLVNHVNSSESIRSGNKRVIPKGVFRNRSLALNILSTEFGVNEWVSRGARLSFKNGAMRLESMALKTLMIMIARFKLNRLRRFL